jgi:hypothetical protein
VLEADAVVRYPGTVGVPVNTGLASGAYVLAAVLESSLALLRLAISPLIDPT